jgi:nitroreductase
MLNKPAITQEKIHDIIQNRWSTRAFDADKDISLPLLTTLIEATRWSSSCFNDQPWRYIICAKSRNEDKWNDLLGCLVEKNQQWAKNAPVLILAVAMENFTHNGKPNRWAQYDTGAASYGLCLQAVSMGLFVHQMGGFDVDKARSNLDLPADCMPMSVMAVGYKSSTDILDEELKAFELSERSRKPQNECFYFGSFGIVNAEK